MLVQLGSVTDCLKGRQLEMGSVLRGSVSRAVGRSKSASDLRLLVHLDVAGIPSGR